MLTLYDFETNVPGKSISPSSLKVRLALNYKNIPHKSAWFKFCDIQKTCKELGLPSNSADLNPDGTPKYTFPIIYDPSTNTHVSDSMRIIDYLDATYPSTPRLIDPNTKVLLTAFEDAVFSTISPSFVPLISPPLVFLFDDEGSRTKIRERVEGLVHTTVEAHLADTQAQDELWTKAKAAFDKLDGYFRKAEAISDTRKEGLEGPFIGGETIKFADLHVGSFLLWIRRILGEEHEGWRKVVTWNEGRWGKVMERLEPFAAIY